MRLINFGAGEVSDRLSILTLKILYGEEAGKDTSHWKTERATLLTKMNDRLSLRWLDAYTELAAVNAAIWENEDTLRMMRQATQEATGIVPPVNALTVAFRSQRLNDRRNALIEQINKDVGEHLGSEKLT